MKRTTGARRAIRRQNSYSRAVRNASTPLALTTAVGLRGYVPFAVPNRPLRAQHNHLPIGFSYLWFLRKLADGFEASWPTLSAAMERIRSLLVTRAGMLCNVTIRVSPVLRRQHVRK